MKYTKIPETAFSTLQLNAGVLLRNFTPSSASLKSADILGATSGGVNFDAAPTYNDYGDDVDNCPKNTKELKRLDSWDVKMTGTFITVDTALAKTLIAAADIDSSDSTKITPRNDLDDADFTDIWWVGDYSDKNGDSNGGFVAIHMLNTLSTGGFSLQSSDKAKGQFSFEFTGHYSIEEQDKVPFEVYIKAGSEED